MYIWYEYSLEDFGVLTGVGIDVSKFFVVGTGVFKRNIGAEPEPKNATPLTCDFQWLRRKFISDLTCVKPYQYQNAGVGRM